jgi:hypothetical protein
MNYQTERDNEISCNNKSCKYFDRTYDQQCRGETGDGHILFPTCRKYIPIVMDNHSGKI